MTIVYTPLFRNDVRFYIKKRHYEKIFDDIKEILLGIEHNLTVGAQIAGVASGNVRAYKARARNSSANVGKSNGFRLIYCVVEDVAYILTIYSKKDTDKIPTDKQIAEWICQIIEQQTKEK